ncbi:MAG: hypothetical protein N2447_07535 [Thermoanaerobaculum sp.]|nr:hypothetical protein [Thermoanaerobaculum sp.]
MGKEPSQSEVGAEELAYYRAVEDHFCRLRGTPFLFSPKDFAYLRRWWQEGVPLSAILLALGEVFAKKRQRGEDPVSSLAYCRHAVARQARRLAQLRAGGGEGATVCAEEGLTRLITKVAAVRDGLEQPRLRELLAGLVKALESLPRQVPPATLAELLAELEEHTLAALWEALPPAEQAHLQAQLQDALPPGVSLSEQAWRVALLREVRERLGLPRLELTAHGG